MSKHENDLVEQGLARWYRGRLIPIMRGGDGTDDPVEDAPLFPDIPEDFAALTADELQSFVDESVDAVREATSAASEYVTEDFTVEDLYAATAAQVAAIRAAKEALAALTPETPAEPVVEPDFAALADEVETLARGDDPDPEDDPAPEDDPEAAEAEETASADLAASGDPSQRRALPSPRRARLAPAQAAPTVALTAAAPNLGYDVGEELPGPVELASMMERRRGQFGIIPAGTKGEKIPIARADWSGQYPPDRRLGTDVAHNLEIVAAATDPDVINREMTARREGRSLVATGGLCAPVTPYYQLAMVSVAERPVRAALPAFNADRGGIRYARPATLASITTAVGKKTAAQDRAGGTEAQKTCQVVDCPPFIETDVQILFHCLQFGNLGARTFPERVAQWNNLVLAAHARLAESELLTGIDAFSTQVTAANLGLGASAALPSQILAAAEGMRNRHRMAPDAVLRVILPRWVLSLLVSDVYRSQFDRFDMTPGDFIALLRAGNVEPTFHIDGANGRGQVFDAQTAGTLDPFPADVVWYLFPEGSFLFVDGGTLELGLVRDSVLNRTNDFQIFGESFENVAFVGVESIAVSSPLCDTGIVSGPTAQTHTALACPYTY